MKNIKNYLKLSAVVAMIGIAVSLPTFANTVSVTLPPNTFTNIITNLFSGSVRVTQITYSTTTSATNQLQLVDTPTNALTYTNLAYTNILSYATNVTVSWTNYYGVSNGYILTNALIDFTNTVPSTTNNWPVRMTLQSGSNSTISAPSVNYYFVNGVWATNSSSGTNTVTITFQQ